MPRTLSERDIRTKFITPVITAAGWDLHSQIHKEVTRDSTATAVAALKTA